MLTSEQIENICTYPESPTLDFKREFYDFGTGPDDKGNASFIKDVISMSNTIRSNYAYILFGIDVSHGEQAEFIGIENVIDDAILQDKIKNKLHPRPEFLFYHVECRSVKIGVLEFPLRKYSSPISATVKMRGIEPGKFYYRLGTSNTEALGHDAIRIYEWMQSLPSSSAGNDKNKDLQSLLVKTTNNQMPLSQTIAAIYAFSKLYKIQSLLDFCSIELQGVAPGIHDKDDTRLGYRSQEVFFTYEKVEINRGNYSSTELRKAFKESNEFHQAPIVLSHSINELEMIINNFNELSENGIATLNVLVKDILGEDIDNKIKDIPITIYVFKDDFVHVYTRIRQKAIDLLLRIE